MVRIVGTLENYSKFRVCGCAMYYSDLLVQGVNETCEPLSCFKITEYVYFLIHTSLARQHLRVRLHSW